MFKQRMPGLAALAHYDRAWFGPDLLAGLSVAAVAVPIAIAYAQLAGVPPVYGLYASILPLIAYAIFGTSRQLIIAPDAATCAMVATLVASFGTGDLPRTISLTMMLTIFAGLFCILAGVARLGFLTNFLARPILTGYLNGIALSIISGQLGKLCGFSLESEGFFRLLIQFFSKLGQTHALTLIIGISFFLLLLLSKRWMPKVPGPLLAMVLGILASSLFDLGQHGVTLLGSIPAGLPALMVPKISLHDLGPLVLGAMGLALVSYNSGMVTARGFAAKNRYEIDPNQEFIALGVADLGAGLLQGFAVSGADSRTAVNDSVGGKSQATSLVTAGLLVLVLFFFTGPLAALPITVLAAVLVYAALGLFDLKSLVKLRRISRPEYRLSLIATLGVITLGVLPGVMIAIGAAIIQLLIKASDPHDAILGHVPEVEGFHDIESHPKAKVFPNLIIYRFDASLIFFNADIFRSRIRALVAKAKPGLRWFLLDAETMVWMDTTGAARLEELVTELAEQGISFAVAEAKKPLRGLLERTGLVKQIGPGRIFPTVGSAVKLLSSRNS